MGNIYRGIRNLWRNRSRTAIVLVILTVAAGLALVMLGLDADAKAEVKELTSRVGTVIEVVPAGVASGHVFLGSGSLPSEWVEEIAVLPGVASVSVHVLAKDPWTPICHGVVPGLPLEWVNIALNTWPSGSAVKAGRGLEPQDKGSAVVFVGEGLAEREGLSPGDRLLIKSRWFVVVGIYCATMSERDGVIMPYDVALELFHLKGVSRIVVRAEKIGQVQAIRDTIWERYGHEADVYAHKDTKIGELESSSTPMLAGGWRSP